MKYSKSTKVAIIAPDDPKNHAKRFAKELTEVSKEEFKKNRVKVYNHY